MIEIVIVALVLLVLFFDPIADFVGSLPCLALLLADVLIEAYKRQTVLWWISIAWTVSWAIVAFWQHSLWPVALLGFVQNVAFTFVSRGRNSGSLGYHLVASIFSNGIYAALLFTSIDMISQAKSLPIPFLVVYTLATMSGSIFAHWLALRTEKGKGRSVQEDRMARLEARVSALAGSSDITAQMSGNVSIGGLTRDGR